MAWRCFSGALITLCLSAALFPSAQAQNQSQPTSQPGSDTQASSPGYTFRAESRVVLTDVTVSDRNGNPVHGLPAKAFRLFDNNKPQPIASFEEHNGATAATVMPASTAPGVYSNDYLLHLPPVLNVVLLDTTNLEIPDQMYLSYQLTRFLKKLPAGQPLSIYLRGGPECILLQNFTSDHALLESAVQKALPRFPPTGREYLNDTDTLHQLAVSLSELPGRKNILWFSGGSTLYLREDATVLEDSAAWRALYDELEQERIAVYPIDARGLTIRTGLLMWAQHGVMNDVAQATGGEAFYNSNGLDLIAAKVIDSDRSFYTLTYSPQDFRFDNKWHKVRVEIEGGYHLSYRTGYFADGSIGSAEHPEKPRTRLLAGGEKVVEPVLRSAPIVFEARLLSGTEAAASPQPAAADPRPKRGTTPLTVRYTLPVNAFTIQTVEGRDKLVLGLAAFSFNGDGVMVEKRADRVSVTLKDGASSRPPDATFNLDEQVNLPKGENYLYLAVWDMSSGRLGTLQIPVAVSKAAKAARVN